MALTASFGAVVGAPTPTDAHVVFCSYWVWDPVQLPGAVVVAKAQYNCNDAVTENSIDVDLRHSFNGGAWFSVWVPNYGHSNAWLWNFAVQAEGWCQNFNSVVFEGEGWMSNIDNHGFYEGFHAYSNGKPTFPS
ncbi:MAG: hypothetical protein ACRD2W_03395 [Acidimicrobiales bacterium]